MLLEFLQHCDPLFEAHVLGHIQFILEDVTAGVVGCDTDEFLEILRRPEDILQLDGEFTERVDDIAAVGVAGIGEQQDLPALIVSAVDLVQIADGAEHLHTLDLAPVDRVGDLHGFRIAPLADQCLDLVRPELVLVFIQRVSPRGNAASVHDFHNRL